MKKFTHAWLAMMAMKRLEFVEIEEEEEKKVREELITWFKNNRDYVIKGSWYPDAIIKDNATSHVLKYVPDGELSKKWSLPEAYFLYHAREHSSLYSKTYSIVKGNLPDRCEALAHCIIDNLKIQESEDKGSAIIPTDNHIAALFFMLSHYIADAHMPFHCDDRPFSEGENLHAKIEEVWEKAVKEGFDIDFKNERFLYNPEGYPLSKVDESSPMIDWVVLHLTTRDFSSSYGAKNNNTWDFLSAVTFYSYLTAYQMIPAQYGKDLKWEDFLELNTGASFEEYSQNILLDTIDSISRVWFRIWKKYRNWSNQIKSNIHEESQ
jgi:hypothetical protein